MSDAEQPDSEPPFHTLAAGSGNRLLLICDHASNRVPPDLHDLGLDHAELHRHIAYDIGIAGVTERLSHRLSAPAVLSNFSRLVIDPNRQPGHETSIPEISDGVLVPANQQIGPLERARREAAYFTPYHQAIEAGIAAAKPEQAIVVSMHSFTPVMEGDRRPWEIAILWNEVDGRLAHPMMQALAARGYTVGDNEPYSGADEHGFTLQHHAEPRNLPHVLIELRQDQIDTHEGQEHWARELAEVLLQVTEDEAVAASLAEPPRHGR